MKILHIVADGRPGGGTTNVLALMEDLLARGIRDVELVTQGGSYAEKRAQHLGTRAFGIDFFSGRFNPRVPIALGRIVRDRAPSLVHVHGARAGFFYALARVPSHVPSAYTVRGYHFLRKSAGVRQLAALAEHFASLRTDATVHVCHYDSELARRWRIVPTGKREVVIHNGIRLDDIPASSVFDPKTIVFLGRLTYQKDPLMVVKVAEILAPEGFRFVLIGGGDMEAEVREAVANRGLEASVQVLGSLPREEALEAMRGAGAFLLPSRWEGFPIAPVEAMEMGLPVVLAAVSGMPEVVDGGRAGVLVETRDPEVYANEIRRLANSKELRDRLVSAGREVIRQRFTREAVTDRYIELYRELLKEDRG